MKIRSLFAGKNEPNLRATLEELIEENSLDQVSLAEDERIYLANVLKLNNLSVVDIMKPRADIKAIDLHDGLAKILEYVTQHGHSRLPVYQKTLDDVVGMIHIRDLISFLVKTPKAKQTLAKLKGLIRPLIIVAPSLPILDLLIKMQKERQHLALVVDEFGGIDGLVTIEDIVEEIVGEIEDEHDSHEPFKYKAYKNKTLLAEGRVPLDILEQHFQIKLRLQDLEDVDTIGGLAASIAGYIPVKGEIIKHEFIAQNLQRVIFEFKILERDTRKIKKVKIKKVS